MSTIVVGGGVVGLNIAWSLRRRGEDVTVVDGGRVGSAASGVNAGWVTPSLSAPLASPGILSTGLRQMFDPNGALIIRPRPDPSWVKWLWNFSRAARPATFKYGVRSLMQLNDRTLELFDELQDDGVEFEMHKAGILALAFDDAGLDWFRQLFDTLRPLGFPGAIEYLSGDQARERDPAVGRSVQAAAHTQIDRFVDPDGLVEGLSRRLTELGVDIIENRPVNGLWRQGDSWLIETNQGPLGADHVVVALGAAANSVLKSVGVKLPVVGAKGYSVQLTGEGEPPQHAMYLMESKLGLSPLENGVRIAGFFEMPGKGQDVPQRRVQQLIEQTKPYMGGWRPTMGQMLVGRGGLRPSTPDSLPFIGPVPSAPGVYVAVGHGMLGVTLAPATAAAITSMITERTIPDYALPFQLAHRV